jgi:superfamily II DNA or RNA helicase
MLWTKNHKGILILPSCKIIIKDEVNVKIENLDLDARKALVKKFKYEDPTARYRPSYKLGRWDGAISFFGLGGTTYLSMLPQVLEYLEERNYYIELEDQRNPTALKFDQISEDFWGEKCWPVGHRFAGHPIRLRGDQVEVINKFLENPQCIQEIATGFGKTITTATLAKICEKYGRTVTIVPNKSLVEQTEEDFINCGLDVGVYYGDRKDIGKTHTICTWQSLNILDKKSKNDDEILSLAEFLEGVQCVMVDEVHMAKAEVLKKLLTQNLSNACIRWGLTGTVPKEDFEFQSLKASLGDVVHRVAAHELQAQGVLAQCHVNIVQTAEWKEFGSYAEELKYLVTNSDRMTWISNLIKEISASGNTLVLVDRIESGKFLQAHLSELFSLMSEAPDVAFVSGEVKTKARKEQYDEIKTADNKIIVATYGVAAVGINIPRIFNLVLLESGKSFTRVIQSIGRGIRKADDKDFVQIWDLTASTKYAKRHLTQRKKFYKDAKYPFEIQKVKYI